MGNSKEFIPFAKINIFLTINNGAHFKKIKYRINIFRFFKNYSNIAIVKCLRNTVLRYIIFFVPYDFEHKRIVRDNFIRIKIRVLPFLAQHSIISYTYFTARVVEPLNEL